MSAKYILMLLPGQAKHIKFVSGAVSDVMAEMWPIYVIDASTLREEKTLRGNGR